MRTSYSLNRINEIHESELTDNEEEDTGRVNTADNETDNTNNSDREAAPADTREARSRRQFTPQLSSESEGEPPPGNDILTRYLLDTLGRSDAVRQVRQHRETTEDSLNSSDSEYNTEEDRRRNKVNLRQLEERLNMIQEECNRSDDDDGESDDERSATIDDKSERNEPMDILDDAEMLDNRSKEVDDLLSDEDDEQTNDMITSTREVETVFSKIDQFLDNSKFTRGKNPGRSRSEGWNFSDSEELSSKIERGRSTVTSLRTVQSSRGRPRSAPPRTDKKLHRAHRSLVQGVQGVYSVDIYFIFQLWVSACQTKFFCWRIVELLFSSYHCDVSCCFLHLSLMIN